jgi:hypothetical protein
MAEAEPSAAASSVSTKEYNATPDAVDGLADALADPEITAETDVDVPELVGLQEQETDTVLDKTASTDALYGVVCQSFDDEKLGARSTLLEPARVGRPGVGRSGAAARAVAAEVGWRWATGRPRCARRRPATGKRARLTPVSTAQPVRHPSAIPLPAPCRRPRLLCLRPLRLGSAPCTL